MIYIDFGEALRLKEVPRRKCAVASARLYERARRASRKTCQHIEARSSECEGVFTAFSAQTHKHQDVGWRKRMKVDR